MKIDERDKKILINFHPLGEPEASICCVIPAQNRVLRARLPVQLKAPACFCLFGLWPKIQATRFKGGS